MTNTKQEKLSKKFNVKIKFIKPLLMNKYITKEKITIPTEDKLHKDENNRVGLPVEMLYGFLFNQKPQGCAMRYEGKQGKKMSSMGYAYVAIRPEFVFLIRDKKEIVFTKFGENGVEEDERKGGVVADFLKRPRVDLPLEAEFELTLYKNDLIDKEKIEMWFRRGGIEVGMGAFRPRFGQFIVEKFEEIK